MKCLVQYCSKLHESYDDDGDDNNNGDECEMQILKFYVEISWKLPC